MNDEFEILPSPAINALLWNNCIQQHQGLIYATTGYLNTITDNWSGLIFNNYELVMPIPWRKKMGIRYCYDVPFLQQTGWIGNTNPAGEEKIINALFSFCQYGDYSFNHKNISANNIQDIKQCNNYVLDLSSGWLTLQKQFSTDLLQNLKKASKEHLVYSDAAIEEAVDLYKTLYRSRIIQVKENDYRNFMAVCNDFKIHQDVMVRKVTTINNKILACALFLRDENRYYNLMNSTTEQGRKCSGNHFLFFNFIREFGGEKRILDFEGSDIPGIRDFYKNFGASNQPYFQLHFNRLPYPLKLFKQ